MPSLRSIGVHPQLLVKLETLKPSVDTPQALLSRDPATLARLLKVPIHIVDDVRCAVADALISSSKDGRRSSRVSAVVNDGETEIKPMPVGSNSVFEYSVYHQLIHTAKPISSGSEVLDKLLGIDDCNPGLTFGSITQLTGPPSSGKTQIALALAAQHANNGGRVVYLASGFGHGTIVPLACRLSHYVRKENYERVLTNVQFNPIVNGYQALAFLLQLEDDINTIHSGNEGMLVILDSASGILAADLYANGDGGAGIIIAQQVALQLKKMVRNYNLAILVTNGTVSGGKGHKAAMGQVWRVADIQIWVDGRDTFDEIASMKVIQGRLEKHPFRSLHQREVVTDFAITSKGIVDLTNQTGGFE